MAVTRIKNNQITDASAGNVYLGIDASTKLQNFSITATKLANGLVYDSNLTITGNLTVDGTTTAINTVNTIIEDPLIVLADGQTSGSPTVDIGIIGLRGSQLNSVIAWKENQKEFVTALSNTDAGGTSFSNTTFNISSYADFHTGNLIVEGITSLIGNVLGATDFTDSITASGINTTGNISAAGNVTAQNFIGNIQGNLAAPGANSEVIFNDNGTANATAGFTFDKNANTVTVQGDIFSNEDISAVGQITGGNIDTGGTISATGTATVGNLDTGGNVSATGNVTGGNVFTGGEVSAAGNVTGGNLITSGYITATGDVSGANFSVTGNITPTANVTYNLGNNTNRWNSLFLAGNTIHLGNLQVKERPANTFAAFLDDGVTLADFATGNLNSTNITGSNISVTGTVTANGTITGGNVATSGTVSAAGTATVGNLATPGTISATGNITTAEFINAANMNVGNVSLTGNITLFNVNAFGRISTAGNVIAANIFTSGVISATGTATVGNLATGGTVSAAGTVTGGNIDTGGTASVAGTATVGNLATGGTISATGTATVGNLATGGTVSATGTATLGNVDTGGTISATGTITSANTITGGNIATGGTVSATGNITGANLLTGGLISAAGNITGGNVVTPQIYNATALTINTGTGNVNIQPAGNLVLTNTYINSLAEPIQDQDAATKLYVDTKVSTGISYHESVVAATATTLDTATGGTVSYNQPNGVGNGQGAFLQTTGTFTTIDTANINTVGTRILVKNEANAAFNGIYTYSNATAIVRATDADTYAPADPDALSVNDYFFVESGFVNAGAAYVVDAPVGIITFGTSNIAFAQFSASQTYFANTQAGISLVGQTFNAKVDNITTAFDGGGNISVKVSANLTTPNIGAATGTSLSVTGDITGANVFTGGAVSATGTITGGNVNTGGNISATGNVTAANFIGNIQGNLAAPGANTEIIFNDNGIANATAGFTFDKTTNTATVGNLVTSGSGGDISGSGNVLAGGFITANGTVTGGNLATGGTASVAGTITGGNVDTGGTISATGNITTANTIIAAGAQIGNISVTGNIQANAVLSVTVSASGNVIGGNIDTGGVVSATGTITGGNIATAGTANVTGTITGGNINTGGTVSAVGTATVGNLVTGGIVSAVGQITGGNIDTAGKISATGNIETAGSFSATGNVQGGNILTTGAMSATGNVTAANFIGNIQGNISAPGANTDVIFNDNGTANATAGFTFNKTSNAVSIAGTATVGNLATGGTVSATGTATVGNLATGGTISATGTATVGNVDTGGNVSATGTITGGNINTGGTVSATGNITSANLILTSGSINGPAAGAITFNSGSLDVDFAVNGSTNANILYIDAGTGTASFGSSTQTVNSIVSFNATNSIVLPVGNTAQRPAGVTGQFRFNSSLNTLEVYDNNEWIQIGATEYTLITDQQFAGDGSTLVFTLAGNSTTAATIVSINGVQQIPTTAYAVTNNILTFTEAPEIGDAIDVRVLLTTTEVNKISNSAGNAEVSVSDLSNVVTVSTNLFVTGTASVTGNVTALNFVNSSDATLKTHIQPITNAAQVIDALSGVGYDWVDGSGHAYGLIAQAVEQVLPEAVVTGANGIKSVNYNMVIPFLIERSKLQSQEIAELKDIVYQLLAR